MEQRRINAMVFGFIGALLGVLLGVVADASTITQFTAAILTTASIGALIGWYWSQPVHTRR